MGSSCGPCSITGVLKYYGVQGTHYDLKLIAVEEYERQTGNDTLGNGNTRQLSAVIKGAAGNHFCILVDLA